jgi:hypothetical protein
MKKGHGHYVQKVYGNINTVKLKLYSPPDWPLEISGVLYRMAFRKRKHARALGVLKHHVVLAYDKINDIVIIGRKPWWK